MNCLFVTSARNASGGGRQAVYLAQGLQARGHAVRFFSPPQSALRQLAPDLFWADLPEKRWLWKKYLESAMPPGEPVIVHAFHGPAVKALSWCGTLWRLARKPIACVAHRGVIYKPRNFLPYLLPGIRLFVVNSHACYNTLPLLRGKGTAKVVYNCIPESRVQVSRGLAEMRRELGASEGERIIGCVSNDSPVKGVAVLLRAFAEARLRDCLLCHVGGTVENWMPLCRELGIADKVRFVGRTEAVADYLQTFTLFVLPSLYESSPNTLLEAMCMGLPALCSKVGGVPEYISDQACLAPPGDSARLARQMAFLLDDEAFLLEAARRNKEFSARFSVRRKLDSMESLYADLLDRLP